MTTRRWGKILAGHVFGRLTVIDAPLERVSYGAPRAGRGGQGRRSTAVRLCNCVCGKQVKVRQDRLVSGKTRSCGCLRADLCDALSHDYPKYLALLDWSDAAKKKAHECAPWPGTLTYQERTYGLLPGGYKQLLDAQNGTCMICGTLPSSGKPLNVDHDHKTGKIRGLLCTACNHGLGCFEDDIMIMAKAIHYLQSNSLP